MVEYINYRGYIKGRVQKPELLAMLAEEAAELGHASLKLRRAICGENPTPVSEEEAQRKLLEEVADVLLILEDFLDIDPLDIEIDNIRAKKLERWYERLKSKEENKC